MQDYTLIIGIVAVTIFLSLIVLFAFLHEFYNNKREHVKEIRLAEIKKLDKDTLLSRMKRYIEIKLNEHGFVTVYNSFEKAIKLNEIDQESSLSEIRKVFEGLVKELVVYFSKNNINSMKKNIEQLELIGILRETPKSHNSQLEVTFLYNLYGLLSNYGSHHQSVKTTEEVVTALYYGTIYWIYFLLKRAERKK